MTRVSLAFLPLSLGLLLSPLAVAVGASVSAPLSRVSATSPFTACTSSDPGNGARTYTNGEVEPSVAVNPTTSGMDHSNLIGVWQQDRHSTGAARGIVASYSADREASIGRASLVSPRDGGRRWTRPVRVNKTTGNRAFTPSIATSGLVAVTYYDLRSQTEPSLPMADYWFATSSDAGEHFTNETHLDGPFDLRWAPFS